MIKSTTATIYEQLFDNKIPNINFNYRRDLNNTFVLNDDETGILNVTNFYFAKGYSNFTFTQQGCVHLQTFR